MSYTSQRTDGSTIVRLTCAETAKLVRAALKKAFPGVKFSVRSETYSMGASIHVRWTDGPTDTAVRAVTDVYAGADFDGMVDLKVYCDHWLHPDGTVTLAHRPGTNGSFVEQVGDPVGPTAQLVSFGADYVFTNRKISGEWKAEILDVFAARMGVDRVDDAYGNVLPLHVTREGELLRMVDAETEQVGTLVHRYTGTRTR